MRRWLFLAMLWCVASLLPPAASAFVDEPSISPSNPTTSTPISLFVRAGDCHAISDDVDQAELVIASPGQLRLMTEGVVLPTAHPFCIHPPFTYRFEIGTLPAGSYTLQIFIHDDFAGPAPVGFGTVSFVVASPAPIPAVSLQGVALMFAALGITGAIAARLSSRG